MSPTIAPSADSLDAFVGREVWVVGDLMLDEYVTGIVERVSPEAPVPVLRVRGTELRVGGAANVARQLATLGGRVSLAGVVGSDDTGRDLLSACTRAGVDTRAVVAAPDRRTTRKLRVLAQSQQLLRLDWEEVTPSDDHTIAELLKRLEIGPPPSIIVLSDYAKGVVTASLVASLGHIARTAGCRLLIDPKRPDFGAYRGAQILTPNLTELAQAGHCSLSPDDLDAIVSTARTIAAANAFEALIVTLGDRGLLLVPLNGPHRHISAARRAVFDVTGAGDTAIAVLAAALATGATLEDGAVLANAAAGVAVGEVGTAAITREQIGHALAGSPSLKILDRDALNLRVTSWRLAGKRIVFTNGCFDLLHAGHLSLLQAAAQHGDVLVLAINSDASVRRLKGPDRPLVPAKERAALLAALGCVDAVTVFAEDTPLETLEVVRPDVLVKGQDYRADEVVGRELVERDGGRVALVPLYGERSTSSLLERIRKSST